MTDNSPFSNPPVPAASRLLVFRMPTAGTSREILGSISGWAHTERAPASIGDGENAYSAWIESVSGNYFEVLGVKPILGRTFPREENGERAKAFTAVISYRLWQNYFRSD